MKTTKKVFAILLSLLMLTGCFGLFASAVTVLSTINLTCPAPVAGGAFPTAADVECATVLKVNSIYIYEVRGDTSVKATAPFEAGKTYEIDIAVATRTSSYNFDTSLSASVNGESCTAVYLTRTTANVVWTVTVYAPEYSYHLVGVAEPQAGGTVDGTGWYLNNGSLSATANEGWYFLGWYEGETFLTHDTSLYSGNYYTAFSAGDEISVTAKFVSQDAFISLKDSAFDDLEVGDWYFNFNEFIKILAASSLGLSSEDVDVDSETFQYMVKLFAGSYSVKYDPETGTIFTQSSSAYFGEGSAIYVPEDGESYNQIRAAIHQADKKVVQNWVTVKYSCSDNLQRGDWVFEVDFFMTDNEGFTVGGVNHIREYYPGYFQSEAHIQKRNELLNSFSEIRYNPMNGRAIVIDLDGTETRDFEGEISRLIRPYKYRITLNEVDVNNLKNGDWYMDGGPAAGWYYDSDGVYHGAIIQYAPEDKEISDIGSSIIHTYYPGDEGYEDYAPYIKQYNAPTQPDNPQQPDNPGNGGNNNNNQNANRCHWCGKTHDANFFQKIIGFFHNILAKIFGNKY